MGQRPVFATLLVVLTLALASCSPPAIGTIGIERQEDGSLQVLIRMCRGSVDTLILNPVNSFPYKSVTEEESDEWRSVPNIEAPLSPPIANDANVVLPFAEDALRSDVLYELWAAGREGNAFSGLFSASELASVHAGEVLVQSTEDLDGVYSIVVPEDFEAISDDFCR